MFPEGEHVQHSCLVAKEPLVWEWETAVFYEVVREKLVILYNLKYNQLLHKLQESILIHKVFLVIISPIDIFRNMHKLTDGL